MMDEKQRWDNKFERLFGRIEKLCKGLAESSLSAEDKADIWTCLWSFLSGMSVHLEKRYPELTTRKIRRTMGKQVERIGKNNTKTTLTAKKRCCDEQNHTNENSK